jgi:hypothetical protein
MLDTNVLSELVRAAPDPAVVAWVRAQPKGVLFDIRHRGRDASGGAFASRWKTASDADLAVAAMFAEDFAGRIRPFDTVAVANYVAIVWKRRAAGRPISQFDAQIAAIALHHGDKLATRNLSDFEGCGLTLIDPWKLAV